MVGVSIGWNGSTIPPTNHLAFCSATDFAPDMVLCEREIQTIHIVLEGYVDKRLDKSKLDANFFGVSIDGVEDFMVQQEFRRVTATNEFGAC